VLYLLAARNPSTWDRLADLLEIDAARAAHSLTRVLGIWVLAYLAIWAVKVAANRIERAVDDGDASIMTVREKRGQTIAQLLRSVGRVVVFCTALLLTLNVFIDIAPILAGAGILGLAISFGAQSLVKDVLAGFFILVENQFALGDVVEAGGRSGVVERMTLRVTMLRDLEGAVHFVPNGEIKTVSNKTRGWSRAVVDVAIPYQEDVDRAIAIVRDEAGQLARDDEYAALLSGPPEVWGVEAINDNAVIIRMVAKTQPGSNAGVAREFRRRIRKRLEVEGIHAPLARRSVVVQVRDGTGSLTESPDASSQAAHGAAAS
jgi:small conductance mechanosensitive channel